MLLLLLMLRLASDPTPWGGLHIRMEMTDEGANLEFDCATGTITQPLRPDSQGRFSVRGTFTPEHGGPIRQDEPSRTRAAVYFGTIDGDAMTLQIDEHSQTYHLVRGKPGRVFKCR
jgi:hypothetical protein